MLPGFELDDSDGFKKRTPELDFEAGDEKTTYLSKKSPFGSF